MQSATSATAVATTARANDTTLFASLELSKSKWVVTINSPGSEKFSKHLVEGGDGAGLIDLLSRSRAKAEQRCGMQVKAIVIQEAGLDGFWIHRLLLAHGIESHVVDAASIAVDRRHRRAKTDSIDGEMLLRALMAWARGERRVCSMVRAPSLEEEDRRRLTRERGTLLKERIQHTNRIKGLLSGQGVRDYNPLRRDCFERLEAFRTGDGRELPPMLKAEIRRELDRIAVVTTQLATVEAPATRSSARTPRSATTPPPCFSSSRAWALSSPRSCGWNRCSATSATDGRWRLTADWRPVPGKAAASNGIRASQSQEIAACARR
jgi:transposase